MFISSVKLVAFHSAFTWLTFRMFALPLTYTATVVCAACALLPFIPTYVVALPPCIALAAQVGGMRCQQASQLVLAGGKLGAPEGQCCQASFSCLCLACLGFWQVLTERCGCNAPS